MKYFSIQYLIKAALSILTLASQINNIHNTSDTCLSNKDCIYCSLHERTQYVYAPVANQLTNNSFGKQYNLPYLYESPTSSEDSEDKNFICVPWQMQHCSSIGSIVQNPEVRLYTSIYTTMYDYAYLPMSITYNRYKSKDGLESNMDIYTAAHIIRSYTNQRTRDIMTHKVRQHYMMPLRHYTNFTKSPSTKSPSLIQSHTKCMARKLCYENALAYLISQGLCWETQKVNCLLKRPVTGQRMLEFYIAHNMNISQRQAKIYKQYRSMHRFIDPLCYVENKQLHKDISRATVNAPVSIYYLPDSENLKIHISVAQSLNQSQADEAKDDIFSDKKIDITHIANSLDLDDTQDYINTTYKFNKLGTIIGCIFGFSSIILSIIGLIIYKYKHWKLQSTYISATTNTIENLHSIEHTPEHRLLETVTSTIVTPTTMVFNNDQTNPMGYIRGTPYTQSRRHST